MNQEEYIGMDIHQATISVAVMDSSKRCIAAGPYPVAVPPSMSRIIVPNGWPRFWNPAFVCGRNGCISNWIFCASAGGFCLP